MALTADYVPKYKGLVSSHPQLEDSSISDDGSTATTKGRNLAVATKTTTYAVLATDEVIIANAPATTFAVTLPAATATGRVVTLKNVNQGIAEFTPNGTDTIDGVNSAAVVAKNGSCTVIDYATGKWAVLY